MFVKRAKPGPPRTARRAAGSSSGDSEDEEGDKQSRAQGGSNGNGSAGQRRKLVSLGDEDEAPVFKVKKTKLSRQMAATKAPADVSGMGGRQNLRQKVSGSRVPETLGLPRCDDGAEVAGREERAAALAGIGDVSISEPMPGCDDGEENESEAANEGDSKAGMAARLARAQRAAARELGGGIPASKADYISLSGARAPLAASTSAAAATKPDKDVGSLSIQALVKAAQQELHEGEEETDAADAWALQQMQVGAHRRCSTALDVDLERELDDLNRDERGSSKKQGAHDRDGQFQVRKAAERVAKGAHSGREETTNCKEKSMLSPTEAMEKMRQLVKDIESGADDRATRLVELQSQRDDAQDQLKEIEKQDKKLAKSLRTVQDLEQLAWSLGGLLDAKAAKTTQASQMLAQIEEDFVRRRSSRRSKDLAGVLCKHGAALAFPQADDGEVSEEQSRQAAVALERRQSRRGPKAASLEADGWETSSASDADGVDECAKDRSAFCAAAHRQLSADVAEEFSGARSVLKSLRSAKEKLQEEYRQAFVHLALPEVFGLFVEHSLLWWDPLKLSSIGRPADEPVPRWGPKKAVAACQFESFDWFEDMANFTELMGDDDPDGELVPKLVQRCIFPEVSRRLRHCWDVTSLAQSRRVAALLDECLLFEVDQSASAFAGLLEAALARLEKGLEEFAPEVFVTNEALPKWYASPARRRLLWRSCKIAHCALQLEGRLPDEPLARLVLQRIFATRMAPHLRAPRTDPEELAITERLVSALPERWFAKGLPPMLVPLRDALGPRAPGGPEAAKTATAAAKILQRLGCFDEAQAIVESLRGR
eukprot:TRINITY_DN42285_c0_g1_i1.p1 TRINITY_DN42285_c0_g1~~TRINITY_DN42285_c0_g1_i1.p1  ORF type:complete len:827 (-),score=223.77 TRINITY_DN42285_c0_g1_i1:25-2505(-)